VEVKKRFRPIPPYYTYGTPESAANTAKICNECTVTERTETGEAEDTEEELYAYWKFGSTLSVVNGLLTKIWGKMWDNFKCEPVEGGACKKKEACGDQQPTYIEVGATMIDVADPTTHAIVTRWALYVRAQRKIKCVEAGDNKDKPFKPYTTLPE